MMKKYSRCLSYILVCMVCLTVSSFASTYNERCAEQQIMTALTGIENRSSMRSADADTSLFSFEDLVVKSMEITLMNAKVQAQISCEEDGQVVNRNVECTMIRDRNCWSLEDILFTD